MLHFVLKRKWFEMIESGVKTEEYRQAKRYWVTRIRNEFKGDFFQKHSGEIRFYLGYRKDRRMLRAKIVDVCNEFSGNDKDFALKEDWGFTGIKGVIAVKFELVRGEI